MSADPTTIIAALVIVLIGKWLQPRGPHAECPAHAWDRQWAGRDTAGPRRDHDSQPHDNAPDRPGGEEEPHPSSSRSWRAAMNWSGKQFAGFLRLRSQPAGNPQQNFRQVAKANTPNASDLGFPAQPSQLELPNAQVVSFASRRSGVRLPLAPPDLSRSRHYLRP
jgi:hypothetical protein